MKLFFSQISLILKLKVRTIIYLFKYRNDAAYLLSIALILLFFFGNLFSSISVFNIPLVKIFNIADSNFRLLLSNVIAMAIMTIWILLTTIGGINLTHPLSKKQILKYPVNSFTFGIVNIIAQLFDMGVLFFSPFFILLMYTLHTSSLINISFSIIIILTFLCLLIILVNIIKLLINTYNLHSKTKYFLGLFILFVIVVFNFSILIIILKSLNMSPYVEDVTQYFFIYPTVLLIKALNNIALGNHLIALFWWVILLIEVVIIFSLYLLSLRYISTSSSKKSNISRELFSYYNTLYKKEKLFFKILNFVPQSNAFIVKDIFYILKNPRMQIWFFLNCACVWIISILQIDTFFRYIIMISTPIMILLPLASNFFAFEGSGLLLYFITPISVHSSIFQKNVAIFIIGILFTIPIIIWALIINSVSTIIFLISIPILLYQLYVMSIFGTIISIYFPYKVKYNSVIGQFNPMVSQPYIFFSFAISEGLLALIIIIFFRNKLVLLFLLIVLAIITIMIYNILLKYFFKGIFIKRKESLIKEIIKSEIKFYE